MTRMEATPIAGCRTTQQVALVALGVTLMIALVLFHQRASVGNPFELPIFRHLILFQDVLAVFPYAAIVLLALYAPVRELGLRAAESCGRHPGLVAAATVAALAVGAVSLHHAHPLSMDEYAMLFQSRIFAEGRLAGQLPPALTDWLAPPWLQGRFIRMSAETGAAASLYWPGFALLLTPFTALGVPWLLNPLLGGATVLVMHRLAMAFFARTDLAGLAVLCTLASPAVTLNAVTYYAMPAHLLANALFVLLLLQPGRGRAFAAGLVGSFALVLHNPAPHLLFCLPWFAWLAFRPERRTDLPALIAGYVPLSLALGWGWSFFLEALSARATVASSATVDHGVALLLDRLRTVFGWTSETGHGGQLYGLAKLWLWASPGLALAAVAALWRMRGERGPWLPLIGSALLTYFAYFLVKFDQGHGWGFRYFHSAWLAVPLLAAAFVQRLPDAPALRGYLAGCALLALPIMTALFGDQMERHVRRHLNQETVLLEGVTAGTPRVVILNQTVGYYTWDLAQNDPFLRNPRIRLISRGPQLDAAMMARQFPGLVQLYSDMRGSVWGTREPPAGTPGR